MRPEGDGVCSMRCATILALIVAVGAGARVAEGGLVTVDFSGGHNARMQEFRTAVGFASEYPEGLVTLGGIAFAIPEGGFNTWSANAASGASPGTVTLDVGVGAFGVEAAHLLVTTHKGERLPGTFALLEFFGSGGAYHAKALDGDVDVRDWLYSEYTNAINGTSTVEVFAAGSRYHRAYRLDMLTVELPEAFRSQSLETIWVTDWGSDGLQRVNIHGITVAVSPVPEPSTLALGLAGVALMGGWNLKRRRDERIAE